MREKIKSMEFEGCDLVVTCESGFVFRVKYPDDAVGAILWAVENDEDFDNNIILSEYENPEDGETFIVDGHEIDAEEFGEMYETLS